MLKFPDSFDDVKQDTDYFIQTDIENVADSKSKAEWVLNKKSLAPNSFTFVFAKTADMYEDTKDFNTIDLFIKFLLFGGFKIKFPTVETHTVPTIEDEDATVITDTLGLVLTPENKRGFEVVADKFRLYPNLDIRCPTRGSKNSAGYDIYSPATFSLEPGARTRVVTDVKAYMLPDEFLQIHIRSSLGIRGIMITNTTGIVDSDYYSNPDNDGNISVFLHNLGSETLYVEEGHRIAQGIFLKYLLADGDDFSSGSRRTGGYGHTGR